MTRIEIGKTPHGSLSYMVSKVESSSNFKLQVLTCVYMIFIVNNTFQVFMAAFLFIVRACFYTGKVISLYSRTSSGPHKSGRTKAGFLT